MGGSHADLSLLVVRAGGADTCLMMGGGGRSGSSRLERELSESLMSFQSG